MGPSPLGCDHMVAVNSIAFELIPVAPGTLATQNTSFIVSHVAVNSDQQNGFLVDILRWRPNLDHGNLGNSDYF